ncbi:MAG: endo alpha-1,4 polygalactosaminidase [Rickettsiales bacterium]|jgi:uncharacterized protein (TIGR01370 family)|nr:endo alpha-1,4 polygalactosaminidase [Rickettsiales bacterium]
MHKRWMVAAALVTWMSMMTASHANTAPERWVVYYTDKLPASAFEAYDVIAFDQKYHPPLEPLKAQGKTLLGYISLGEAEKYRSYFNAIKKKGLLHQSSTLWKGHYYIDVRKPAWTKMVLDELIPPILAKGFDGIMIDTMDSAIEPEMQNPKKYPGMKKASIELIKAIRTRYPDIKIMVNRGLEILPEMAPHIDMLMAESTYTDWVPNPKKPVLVKPETYQYYLDIIAKGRAANPKLKVYSMDYWDMSDTDGVKAIYAKQREQGFVPYVSTMDLQHLHPEPQ